jgi:hypothetical protein
MLSSSLFLKHGYSILVAAVFVHQLAASKLSSSRNLPLIMYWSTGVTEGGGDTPTLYMRFRERVPLTGHCPHVGSRCGQNESRRSTLSLRFNNLQDANDLASDVRYS